MSYVAGAIFYQNSNTVGLAEDVVNAIEINGGLTAHEERARQLHRKMKIPAGIAMLMIGNMQ